MSRRTAKSMLEADLVREVQKHPILYDKSVSGFNKTKMRDDAWKEVQEALNVPETECKKRWRSMRDSFIKLQRTRGGRACWPYLGLMQFLLPHIEIKNQTPQTDESEDDDFKKEPPFQPEITMTVDDSPIRLTEPECCGFTDDIPPDIAFMARNSTEDHFLSCTSCYQSSDPDELFLLSLAPNLKRLNSKQNAVARMRMQQVLFEVEFEGSDMEIKPAVVGDVK